MRKVIVNSTPLIAFSKVGQLELLRTMYGEIYILGAVFEEVTKKNDIVREKILQSDWIHIENIQNIPDRRMYSAKFHAGEVEVMILAQEQEECALVVIDDYAARKTAEFLGLKLTGTVGVLIKAKQKGILKQVMPVINVLLKKLCKKHLKLCSTSQIFSYVSIFLSGSSLSCSSVSFFPFHN